MNGFMVCANMSVPGGTVWSINGNAPFYPENFPSKLSEILQVKKHKGDKTENRIVFINRLRYFGLDVIQVLHVLGYTESLQHSFKEMESKSYTYLIGDNLCFYSIRVKYSKRYTVTFIDLDNFLSMSTPSDIINTWSDDKSILVDNLSKAYVNAVRDLIHLSGIRERMPTTLSGIARRVFFRDRQKYYDCKNCSRFFDGAEPYFRGAYHGGLNLIKDSVHINKYGQGIVLDVNSLYPYVMRNGIYPVGKPWEVQKEQFWETVKKAKDGLVYFFIRIKTSFELKENGIPCVALYQKDEQRWCHDRQFMKDSRIVRPSGLRGKLTEVQLTLTQTDFFLFLENYDIKSIEFVSCVAFQGKKTLFTDYVDNWYELKQQSTGGYRRIAKMMLNSLSGSMARRVDYINGTVYFDDKDQAQIKYDRKYADNPKCYVHIGAAITSYARCYLIKRIKSNYDRWLYSDTDSLHLIGSEIPDNITVSDNLGAFKLEEEFDSICYYGLKEYGYHDTDGYHFTMAGIEKRDTVNLERFCNQETGTNDDWIQGEKDDVKGMKDLFRSADKLLDLYYMRYPVTLTVRSSWFNVSSMDSWKSFYVIERDTKKKPVKIRSINTTVKHEREKDEKAAKYYDKKHEKDKPLPLNEWFQKVAQREDQINQEKKEEFRRREDIKAGEFVDIRETDVIPFAFF